ncbi:MAG: biotin--[acetyl-CoA-carboxylase] ligase family protein [Paludibacteraceae bacterium]|nr:biotin--[acetyl-CoA-carboxylase] ligase family protein [Paludibacteraceae bacterium]
MYIAETNSTNTLLLEMLANGAWPEGEKYLRADFQTAGRGQTGNSWESERGKNLLCSILLPPEDEPFYLTVAVSVALHQVVANIIEKEVKQHAANHLSLQWAQENPGFGTQDLTVKWPNDLYYKDHKLAGMLIEGRLCGNKMQHAIAGIGLNVNQTKWHSTAPNPVSIKTVCKSVSGEQKDFNIDELMEALYSEVQQVLSQPHMIIWERYKQILYRGKGGPWPFVERDVNIAPTMNAPKGTKGTFMARIVDVLPSGELVLQDETGETHTYHFKQIRYVL